MIFNFQKDFLLIIRVYVLRIILSYWTNKNGSSNFCNITDATFGLVVVASLDLIFKYEKPKLSCLHIRNLKHFWFSEKLFFRGVMIENMWLFQTFFDLLKVEHFPPTVVACSWTKYFCVQEKILISQEVLHNLIFEFFYEWTQQWQIERNEE